MREVSERLIVDVHADSKDCVGLMSELKDMFSIGKQMKLATKCHVLRQKCKALEQQLKEKLERQKA